MHHLHLDVQIFGFSPKLVLHTNFLADHSFSISVCLCSVSLVFIFAICANECCWANAHTDTSRKRDSIWNADIHTSGGTISILRNVWRKKTRPRDVLPAVHWKRHDWSVELIFMHHFEKISSCSHFSKCWAFLLQHTAKQLNLWSKNMLSFADDELVVCINEQPKQSQHWFHSVMQCLMHYILFYFMNIFRCINNGTQQKRQITCGNI